MFETQTGRKIKAARSDNGGEYMSSLLKDYLDDKGINHQTTMPISTRAKMKLNNYCDPNRRPALAAALNTGCPIRGNLVCLS
jgi:hypothetical protein